jgi:hypothetical protein
MARTREEEDVMSTQEVQPTDQEVQKSILNKRLESIGWGLCLIMIGGIWLVPDARVPEGTWLIGAGLIMLGLNFSGIKMSGFTIILGILALGFGISDFFGVDLPLFPILIILIGANIILKPLIEKKRG